VIFGVCHRTFGGPWAAVSADNSEGPRNSYQLNNVVIFPARWNSTPIKEVNVGKEIPMVEKNEKEWRALIDGLTAGSLPEPPQGDVAPMFADPKARQRVGDLITKAILGVPLYKLYCGEPSGQP
jgi:hypothetical protein